MRFSAALAVAGIGAARFNRDRGMLVIEATPT